MTGPNPSRLLMVVMVVVTVIALASHIPDYGEICETNQETKKEECARYSPLAFYVIKIGKPFREHGTAIVSFATALLVVVTAALALYTYRLWSAGDKTSRRQLRAYVGATLGEAFFQDGSIVIRMTLKNAGQTPAHNVKIWLAADIRSEEGVFLQAGSERKEWVMMPGVEWRRHLAIHSPDLAAIKSGSKKIWAWGGFEYTDSFGERCHGVFRYRQGHETLAQDMSPQSWALIPDEGGNHAQYGEQTQT